MVYRVLATLGLSLWEVLTFIIYLYNLLLGFFVKLSVSGFSKVIKRTNNKVLLSLNSNCTCQVIDTCSPLVTTAPTPHSQWRLRHSFLPDAGRTVSLPSLLYGIVSIIWKITSYLTDLDLQIFVLPTIGLVGQSYLNTFPIWIVWFSLHKVLQYKREPYGFLI